MQGSSRAAAAAGQRAFQSALQSGADWGTLAEDLFGITAVIDGNATLRRALADPSRDPGAKRDLVSRLFGGKVSQPVVDLLSELVAQRWSTERDLSDTVESLAAETVLASAEAGGRGDQVEDELFRFERIVAGNPELRDALTNRNADPQAKADLVGRLLQGKVSAETARLARQSVLVPRGRRFDRTMRDYLALAARRREQLTAVVTSAVDLDEGQRQRLANALQRIYGKTIQLQMVVDPKVVGGVRVQIGDEVVDGTVLRKLEGARRHIAG
ncbi:MAG TPA: F0F1 ATP synthase subunit delta [Candidatus Limnocylindria bacterium]|jgi:F-type H+-transporting ATPase subunit delta